MIPYERQKPQHEADFEDMCVQVYGVVFGDPLPKKNGRRGQAQRGVDVYVRAPGFGTIGVQCKKYTRTKLTWNHIVAEVKEADDGEQPIVMLLIAATSDADAALQQKVMQLSDERLAKGKFQVSVEFWDDIQNRLDAHPILQERYVPHSPGGVFHRQEREMSAVRDMVTQTLDKVTGFTALAEARADSANGLVTAGLDHANALIKAGRFQDALESLDVSGKDMAAFDKHQEARWCLQRGICQWLIKDDEEDAARLFAKAAALFPGDERMAAAGIRSLMLSQDPVGAVEAGRLAAERFPLSGQVWIATANARLMLGERVSIDDAPEPTRCDTDVLFFASHAARKGSRAAEALELAERAAMHAEAGFFNRECFLALAVEDCASNPVSAQFRLLPKEAVARLERAANLFDPRNERLFAIQSPQAVRAAANLGFALLILGKCQEALALVDDSRSRGLDHPAFSRIEIQALEESGRREEALERASGRLGSLQEDALAGAAEIATLVGAHGFLAKASERAKTDFPENRDLADYLTGLRWGSAARASGKEKAVAEILGSGPFADMGLGMLCAASRILRWADRPIEAEEAENEARSRLADMSPPGDRLLVAETLFLARRWAEATHLYEGLLVGAAGKASDLHARLLACHMEMGNRAKARAVLSALPDGWAENDELRRSAMELGQRVGDWSMLRPLADRHVQLEPGEASSWLFRLLVLARGAAPAEFQAELAKTPDVLRGSVRTLAKLGSLELHYGASMKGLLRLYRLLRSNLDEPEAHSAYLLNVLMGRLPDIDPSPPCVGAGCYVVFEDSEGRTDSLTVDPAELQGLPKRSGFLEFDSEEAAPFIGARVGDEVAIRQLSRNGPRVRVVRIGQAFHRLFHEAQERAASVMGLPYVKSLPVGESGDSEKDLARLHDELFEAKGGREVALDFYAKGHLTLSLLMESLGRSSVDACLGWPSDGPPLFVGNGLANERAEAVRALSDNNRPIVLDASAVAELARFDAGEALEAFLGQALITPKTLEIVSAFVEEAKSGRVVGAAFDDGGRLGFSEITKEHRENRMRIAARMKELVEKRCAVEPAYGDAGETQEERSLSRLLSKEEVDGILLAKERGALLLTLDGRLRALAKQYYGIAGVWPQAVVMAATEAGAIPLRKASEFAISELLSHRHFVSLSAEDLAWMVAQGDVWLQAGMSRLKEYLASEGTEVSSAVVLVERFLVELVSMEMQLGAFGEFISHLAEPVARRKDCPPGWLDHLEGFVGGMLQDAIDGLYGFKPLDLKPLEIYRLRRQFLWARIAEGGKRAAVAPSPEPVRVRVLFCGTKPCVVLDRSSPKRSQDRPADSKMNEESA